MLRKNIFHYSYKQGNIVIVRPTKYGKLIRVDLPIEKVETLPQALAVILNDRNLMRVLGTMYTCSTHNKVHKYSFYSRVSSLGGQLYGFDTPQEVINFAKECLEKNIKGRVYDPEE